MLNKKGRIFISIMSVVVIFINLCFAKEKKKYLFPEVVVINKNSIGSIHFSKVKIQQQVSLDYLLQAIPGLRVRKQSGLGGFSSYSFRGGKSEQILFFLDDFLLNGDGGKTIDVSKIPIRLIRRVEIDALGLKPQSLFYSANLFIYLYTSDQAITEKKWSSSAQIGSFSQYQFSGYYQNIVKKLQYHFFAVTELAKNDFPYFNNRNTEYNLQDDFIDYRSNNQYYNGLIQGYANYFFNVSTRFTNQIQLQLYRRHFPGIEEETSFSNVGQYLVQTGMTTHFKSSMLKSLSWNLMHRYRKDHHQDPSPSQNDRYQFDLSRKLWLWRAKSISNFDVHFFDYQLGLNMSYEKIKDDDLTSDNIYNAPPNAEKTSLLIGQKIVIKLWSDFESQVKFTYSLYHWKSDSVNLFNLEPQSFTQNKSTYHFSMNQQYQNDWFMTYLQYRLEQRFPISDEFLGDNHTIVKNLKLTSTITHLWQLETQTHTWSQTRITLFLYQYSNPIELVFLNNRYSRYENQSAYGSTGIEFSTQWIHPWLKSFPFFAFNLTTQTTYLKSVITDSTSPFFRNVPAFSSQWKHYADLSWSGIKNLALSLTANYKSSYFEGQTNFSDQKQPSYILWSSFIKYDYHHIQLQASVYNIANEIYNDFRYQSNSGRHFFLTITIHSLT